MQKNIAVVIPNLNGKDKIGKCLGSLRDQSVTPDIIVVENGSKDGSLKYLQTNYPTITMLPQPKNLGFAGGVNVGIRYALERRYEYIALLNNDAMADKQWLKHLHAALVRNPKTGIVTCKLMDIRKQFLDSTGDLYTTWGLPYPRGRGEPVSDDYDKQTRIFAASGGASLYRASLFEQIGLFDEDFFAYYEDVDISFRAQLAGWDVRYEPQAIAYHQIGATSSKIKGFTVYQTMKNLPLLLWKNAPLSVLVRIFPRFMVAYYSFLLSASFRLQALPALRGYFVMLGLLPKKTRERFHIQRRRKVMPTHIWRLLTPGLPPNARKLRLLFHPVKTLRGGL